MYGYLAWSYWVLLCGLEAIDLFSTVVGSLYLWVSEKKFSCGPSSQYSLLPISSENAMYDK